MRKLASIASLVLLLSCAGSKESVKEPEELLIGRPVSVAALTDRGIGVVSIVLERGDQFYFVYGNATSKRDYWSSYALSKAVAIVQSEINDGDDEAIKLKGRFKNGYLFETSEITANGFAANLDKLK